MSDRLPPQNRDAERSVLGGLLSQPEVIGDWRDVLSPDRFYFHAHKVIVEAMYAMAERRSHIDALTLLAELNRAGHAEDAGGAIYLGELLESRTFNIQAHADIVIEKAARRDLIHAANEALAAAYANEGPAEELIMWHRQAIDAMVDRAAGLDGVMLADSIN